MNRNIIGIAGYMGSGKTTISNMVADIKGYTLISGDILAKDLMLSHAMIQTKLSTVFGNSIMDGATLSFSKLGEIVFSNEEKLRKLNAIVHPVLLDALHKVIFSSPENSLIIDAALIPLWNITQWFDHCLWIEATSDVRCNRILLKGALTERVQVIQRMNIQESLLPRPSQKKWTYIHNNGSRSELKECALRFVSSFLPDQS